MSPVKYNLFPKVPRFPSRLCPNHFTVTVHSTVIINGRKISLLNHLPIIVDHLTLWNTGTLCTLSLAMEYTDSGLSEAAPSELNLSEVDPLPSSPPSSSSLDPAESESDEE
uniref:Uncharacterized protein n=1 Tax=Eutreptiella gymnastica TaxID=73025 RepID=A0A7S4LC28_9EUGL